MAMGDLLKKVQEKEEKEEIEVKEHPVKKIASSTSKNKMISVKLNDLLYAQFTEINKAYGVSNNSAINMLIATYVKEKKDILNS
jgi:hypothetical protein